MLRTGVVGLELGSESRVRCEPAPVQGTEWTWELPSDSPSVFGAVGVDGVSTVIRARGIEELM